MEALPWFVWIVIAGMLAGVLITLVNALSGRKAELAQALERNTEVNAQLTSRLDGIEARLAAVEKTLNEIPE